MPDSFPGERPVSFRPHPRTFHRYAASEMCGALPAIVYKVLPKRYAQRLITTGEMQWSTLTYFQNTEDSTRSDGFEGMRRYFPRDGVKVHRSQHGDGRPDDSTL